MYLSFVMRLTENGHTSDRNLWELYVEYNIISYTYTHLLILIPHLGMYVPLLESKEVVD